VGAGRGQLLIMGILGGIGRTIDRNAKRVVTKVKAVPVAGGVVRSGQRVLEGPIGTTVHKVLANPYVQTVFGPYTIPYQLALAAATGGVQGATEDAKAALRNPVRRAAAKAVAIVFPPAVAAVAALEASNKALDAIESEDPQQMAKAAAQIGATQALGAEGDADAQRAIEFLDQAITARRQGTSIDALKLVDLLLSDPVARKMLEENGGLAATRPANVREALITLQKVAGLSPDAIAMLPASERAQLQGKARVSTALLGAVLEAGAAHPDSPYFVQLASAVHKDVNRLDGNKSASAQAVLSALEKQIMQTGLKRTVSVNKLVRSYAAGDAATRAHVTKISKAALKGDARAQAAKNELLRRAAALKKAGEYQVDGQGVVRHVGVPRKPPIRR
jgi:hypothetical protein